MRLPIPSRLTQAALRRSEAWIHRIQGKGYLSSSIGDEVRAAVRVLPREGATVFDVGANRGQWARAMLEHGSQVHRLYCFEPSKHNWPSLESIADPRVRLVKLALSDRVGEAVLHSDGPGSELASLTKRDLARINISFEHTETVATSTIDQFMQEEGISKVDYLKLDVEGHELMALAGAEQALRRRAIRALAFEFGGCNIDTRVFFRDFWRLLTAHDYRIYRIAPYGRLWPVAQYSEMVECFLFSNYFAMP